MYVVSTLTVVKRKIMNTLLCLKTKHTLLEIHWRYCRSPWMERLSYSPAPIRSWDREDAMKTSCNNHYRCSRGLMSCIQYWLVGRGGTWQTHTHTHTHKTAALFNHSIEVIVL
jgi:hypothetical protein